jgi:Na+/proline symporter
LRWFLGLSFLVLGICYLGNQQRFDAEKVMPLVLTRLPIGMQGLFLAVLLAALMSTLSAMINVTSSVVLNDFLKRYFARNRTEKQLVRWGQLASLGAIVLGFLLSLFYKDVVSAWVTMILVPATLRWHWWRYSARAFVLSMASSAIVILLQKLLAGNWSISRTLVFDVMASLIMSLTIGFLTRPAEMDVLVKFYVRVRPFGFWGPVRREAVSRGIVPAGDRMPTIDALNGLLCAVFQGTLAITPFYIFLRQWRLAAVWAALLLGLGFVLYWTWYRNLPPETEQ